MNPFEHEVVDRLARIETGMTEHRVAHEDIDRRIGVVEEENRHRSRVSVYVSAAISAAISTVGQVIAYWRQTS